MLGQLPVRLRNFLAKYPPQTYSAAVAPRPTPPETATPAEETLPSPYTPEREVKGYHRPDPTAWSPTKALLYNDPKARNPFLPQKNFRTGKWIGARYGLRQQADLVKIAKKYNVEELLPPGPKSTTYKVARLAERGLRIKGTGIGQKVKGHKWERTMEARLEERRKAMLAMPEMIREWKQVSDSSPVMGCLSRTDPFPRKVMAVAGQSGPRSKGGHFDSNRFFSSLGQSPFCFLDTITSIRRIRPGLVCGSLQGLEWEFIVHFCYYPSSVLYYSRTLLAERFSRMIGVYMTIIEDDQLCHTSF